MVIKWAGIGLVLFSGTGWGNVDGLEMEGQTGGSGNA